MLPEPMEIRVWQAFSCNNSSSYRLVARFRSAEAAQGVAAELNGFLAEARPLARYTRRNQRVPLTQATSFPFTEIVDELATAHNFDWTAILESGVYDDEIVALAEGSALIVYHPYCLGLGADLPAYLRARGAEVESATIGEPSVSVLFRLPHDAKSLKSELTAFFDQFERTEDTTSRRCTPPWTKERTGHTTSASVAFFCDGKTVGFYLPIEPSHIPMLKAYLHDAAMPRDVSRDEERKSCQKVASLFTRTR